MPKNLSNVKEDILSVTRILIKETGYSDLSIRKIASQCGVATGTVYNYYNSKTEIIAEILLNEWNLMLRRIEQSTKNSSIEVIDKLEIIFNELNNFMTNVHGAWFRSYPVSNETNMDMNKIRKKRLFLREQLSTKVGLCFSPALCENIEALNICDIIAGILISYSNDSIEFSKIKRSLEALIHELKSIVSVP